MQIGGKGIENLLMNMVLEKGLKNFNRHFESYGVHNLKQNWDYVQYKK
jgi:hypothetical protein